MDARIKRGAPVSFWNYMATVQEFTQMAFVFGRVLGVGKQRITIRTEFGGRTWREHYEVYYAGPEGEEILRKKGV